MCSGMWRRVVWYISKYNVPEGSAVSGFRENILYPEYETTNVFKGADTQQIYTHGVTPQKKAALIVPAIRTSFLSLTSRTVVCKL
jgi:hypothetical protein